MVNPSPKLTAGILGGMGPEATIDLMRRVIALTPAEGDSDHIRMLVDCDPQVPSRVAAIIEKSGPSPAPALARMAAGLVAQGADFLAMPCNTAHHYYSAIAAASHVPVINMLSNAADRIHREQPAGGRVGMLASTAVSITSLYEAPFAAVGKTLLFPSYAQQNALMQLIFDVKAQRFEGADSRLLAAAQGLIAQGADCLLIACTELSILAPRLTDLGVALFDSAELLAQEIVDRGLGRVPNRRANIV